MEKPENAITIETYKQLVEYIRAFAEGHLTLLIVVGRAGLQKSFLIREALGRESACWIEGNATPFAIYCELWRHRDEPVVIDDVDSIYHDKAAVRLLKSLCQTDECKTVAWHSDSKTLRRDSIPRSFQTRSHVAIIANRWRTLNANVEAIEDRGHVIFFEPTPLEVHQRVAEWFWDQEIFDYIGLHLHLMTRPSMRHYALAYEKKQAGLDWRAALLQRFVSGTVRMVANLVADPSHESEEARARAFTAMTGHARSTYFRLKAELYAQVPPPQITLEKRHPPTASSPALESIISLLRRQYGDLGKG